MSLSLLHPTYKCRFRLIDLNLSYPEMNNLCYICSYHLGTWKSWHGMIPSIMYTCTLIWSRRKIEDWNTFRTWLKKLVFIQINEPRKRFLEIILIRDSLRTIFEPPQLSLFRFIYFKYILTQRMSLRGWHQFGVQRWCYVVSSCHFNFILICHWHLNEVLWK